MLMVISNVRSLLGYIDPAATSVLLSSIVAIVVAIGASAIVIWRKVKKGVSKTLHIDPNANKEVEEDVVLTEDATEGNQEVTTEKKVVTDDEKQTSETKTEE